MTPYEHAVLSVRDFGGEAKDYLKIHEFFDQTKFFLPNWKHRMILHNSFGMKLCEDLFGPIILNSDGIEISVREIARRHIMQDLDGRIPTIQDWIESLSKGNVEPWMNRPRQSDLDWLKNNLYNKDGNNNEE